MLVVFWKALASHQTNNRQSLTTSLLLMPPMPPGTGQPREGQAGANPADSVGLHPADLTWDPHQEPSSLSAHGRERSQPDGKLPRPSPAHGKVTLMVSCCLRGSRHPRRAKCCWLQKVDLQMEVCLSSPLPYKGKKTWITVVMIDGNSLVNWSHFDCWAACSVHLSCLHGRYGIPLSPFPVTECPRRPLPPPSPHLQKVKKPCLPHATRLRKGAMKSLAHSWSLEKDLLIQRTPFSLKELQFLSASYSWVWSFVSPSHAATRRVFGSLPTPISLNLQPSNPSPFPAWWLQESLPYNEPLCAAQPWKIASFLVPRRDVPCEHCIVKKISK